MRMKPLSRAIIGGITALTPVSYTHLPDWRGSLNALKEKTVQLGYAPDMWWIVDWYNLG